MALENRADDVALHAGSFAVNDAHFMKAGLLALFQVFLDDAWNILWLKGMKIDEIFQREDHRLRIGDASSDRTLLVFLFFLLRLHTKNRGQELFPPPLGCNWY